jgi:hypothetical protein
MNQVPFEIISRDHCVNNQDVINKLVNFLPDQFIENYHLSSHEFNDKSMEEQSQGQDELENQIRCSNLCSTSYGEYLSVSLPYSSDSILNQGKLVKYLGLDNCIKFCPRIITFSNLEILPRIKSVINLNASPSFKISRSVIIDHVGGNIYFQSTLPYRLFKSFCLGLRLNKFSGFLSHKSKSGQEVDCGTFYYVVQSSSVYSIRCLIEKLYKNQFHFFSVLKQQLGLILFIRLLIYELFQICFVDGHNLNKIAYAREVNEESSMSQGNSNLSSRIFPPSISKINLHNFYDPINSLMEDVCIRRSSPWHDFILHHSSPFEIF